MATQYKECPIGTGNPWLFEDFTGLSYWPLPGIWYLDGTYESLFFASGYYTYVTYLANNFGFDKSNVRTVTSLKVYLKGIKSTAPMDIYATFVMGLGTQASFTLNWLGNDILTTLTSTPQDITLTLTPSLPAKGFAKLYMGQPDFMLGVVFTNWLTDDTVSIDNFSFEINYTEIDPGGSSSFRNRGGSRGRLFYGAR